MSRDEAAIEREIQEKGLNAPRITPAQIDAQIVGVNYFRASDAADALDQPSGIPLSCLTICVLTLRNGFTVTGESACASPDNYDRELGNKIAFENARQKIWAFEGYALRKQLAENDRLRQLNELVKTASSPGNADANDYLHGMANGLILAEATMRGTEPDYVIRRVLDSEPEVG